MPQRPILHVLDHALPVTSGYAVRSHSLLRHLCEAGMPQLAVASSNASGAAHDDVIDGVTYTRLSLRQANSLQTPITLSARIFGLARSLERQIRARNVRLVHAHSPVINGLAALWAARRTGIPVVYEMRSLWEDAAVARGFTSEGSLRYRTTRWLETRLACRVDAVALISRALVAEVMERGVAADRLFHTPNAIDCQAFVPMMAEAELLARYHLTGATVFGYIGYFFAYEGIDDLLRAFARVRRELPSAKLLLVGSGEGEEDLRALARSLGIEASVIFAGHVPHAEVQRYYSLCDVLVYPRRFNRMTDLVTPLKPLEAMALAKPVVVSDVGGLRELVRVNETGLLCPPSDPDRLAEVLIAIAGDEALRARLGANARRAVTEQHDWTRVVAIYQDAYGRLLASSPDNGRSAGPSGSHAN